MTTRTDRERSARGTRSVLGLLLSVWVSLAIQPCAVAAASEHHCPHCPPEAAAAPESQHHHGSASHHGAAAKPAADCESMQAGCCDLDKSIVNVRVDLPDVDDLTAIVTSVEPPQLVDAPHGRSERPAGPPEPPDGSVPIHLLKCVFLI